MFTFQLRNCFAFQPGIQVRGRAWTRLPLLSESNHLAQLAQLLDLVWTKQKHAHWLQKVRRWIQSATSFLTNKSKMHTQPAAHLTHLFYLLILFFRYLLVAASILCALIIHCSSWKKSGIPLPLLSIRRPCTYWRAPSGRLFVQGQTDAGLGGGSGLGKEPECRQPQDPAWLRCGMRNPHEQAQLPGRVWIWGDQ